MLLQHPHFNKKTMLELMRIAIPMIISQGTFAVMIFTDRYFMSQIDPTNMAAALGGGVAAFFSFCFFSGLFSYANAMAAQYLGAGEIEKCPKVVTQGFIMVALSVQLLMIITLLLSGIFEGMDHDPIQVELERSYYQILMLGVVLTLAKICLSSYFAGIGKTNLVMICDVCGLLLNVPLCYAMVFGKFGLPELGIAGAALSTIIATGFALLLFLLCYFHKAHRQKFSVMQSFKYDSGIFKRFVRLGFPSGVELFMNVAAFNLFLLMFQSYGIVEGASAAIVLNWDVLSFVPMVGLNIGLISMIGRFVGSGNLLRANEAITAGFVLGLSYSAILAFIYITFRFALVEVFAPPQGDFSEILALAGFMMVGLSTYAMADAIIQVCGGVLRGAGDTRWIMYASVSLHWIMLLAQYVIIRVLEWGPKASWLAFVVMILSIALVFVGRLYGGRWRDEEALRSVMAE